jgi:predicted GIY-YIG superfamily endonuclease
MITKINHSKSLISHDLVKVNEKDSGILNDIITTEDDHSYADLSVEIVDRIDFISVKFGSDTNIYIKNLYCKEGDCVQINEPILLIGANERFDNGEFYKKLMSPISGFISFMVDRSNYSQTSLIENEIKIFKEDIFRQRNKYPVHSALEIDEFSKIEMYKWNKLDIGRGLYFYPSNVDGADYINFGFPFKDFNLSAGSSIHFLMSNSEIINFNVINNPSKLSQSEKLCKTPIALGELELLSKHSVEKVRLRLSVEDQAIDIIIADHYDVLKKDLQFKIRSTFSDYLEFVIKLQNHRPLKDFQEVFQEDTQECYVYLMKDCANEFYKIGISNDPKYRERTLQSEKPTIELIGSRKFPTRKIAESFEKALHEAFKEKRLRGEWFELTKDEARQIEISLI